MHSRPSDTQKLGNIAMATELFPPTRPSRKRQEGGAKGGRGRGEGRREENIHEDINKVLETTDIAFLPDITLTSLLKRICM